jgi:hypothetical protein
MVLESGAWGVSDFFIYNLYKLLTDSLFITIILDFALLNCLSLLDNNA